jgi:translation initiation factor 2 subunit 1
MGAYVDLLEYDDIEGMVLLSELSRRRIRSIKKLIGEGNIEVCMVISVNSSAGYIDLSKRRVSPEDKAAYELRYNQAVIVQNTMRNIVKDTFDPDAAAIEANPLRSICERLSWRLYENYPHALAGLEAIGRDPSLLDGYDLTDAEKESLMRQLNRKTRPSTTKVRAQVQVTCFGYEGVQAISRALTAAKTASTPECVVEVLTVAPPAYAVTTTAPDAITGIAVLRAAIQAATDAIAEDDGAVVVTQEPSAAADEEEAVGEQDEEDDEEDDE